MQNRKRSGPLGFAVVLGLLSIFLSKPDVVRGAAAEGLKLCGAVLIPSLFPFFVMTNLFIRRGYDRYPTKFLQPVMTLLFGMRPNGSAAVALGAVGGYPIGASTAFDLYRRGALTGAETARLLAFCNNAGPGFVLGVAGVGLLGSLGDGLLLYVVHLLSAVLVGVLFHLLWGGASAVSDMVQPQEDGMERFSVSFVSAVGESVKTAVTVSGFLVFFAVLAAFLQNNPLWEALLLLLGGLDRAAVNALLYGLLELTGGMEALKWFECGREALLCFSAFLLGWGGLCVHCQVLSLRGALPIDMRPYFLGKLTQGVLSALLILSLSRLGLLPTLCLLAAALLVVWLIFHKTPLENVASIEYNDNITR